MQKYDGERLNSIKYLIKERKLSAALTEIIDYMEDYPTNSYAKYQYGLILKGLRRLDEAFDVFFEIYDSNAQNKNSALYEMGRIKVIQREYDYAKYYFEKNLAESPYPETFTAIELAKIERRFGNVPKAERILQEACNDPDTNTRKYAVLELAKLELFQNKRKEAQKLLKLLKEDDNPKFRRKVSNLKGKIEVAYDRYDTALEYFEEALGTKKDDVYWSSLYEIAVVYEKQGRLQEAHDLCIRLKKEKGLDVIGDVDLLLGNIYKQQGNIQKAREKFLEATTYTGTFIEQDAYFRLGVLEKEAKNTEIAEEYFEKVIAKPNIHAAAAHLELIYIAIRREDYSKCYELIDGIKKLKLNEDLKRSFDSVKFYLATKTGKFSVDDRVMTYTNRQIQDYNEEKALNCIIKRHTDGIDANFNSNIDISALFYGMKDLLTEDKLDGQNLMDNYTIDFPNVGEYQGEELHRLRVICLPNTKNIITMYPYYKGKDTTYEESLEEEYTVSSKKVKRLSQVEKFNARYGKKATE